MCIFSGFFARSGLNHVTTNIGKKVPKLWFDSAKQSSCVETLYDIHTTPYVEGSCFYIVPITDRLSHERFSYWPETGVIGTIGVEISSLL